MEERRRNAMRKQENLKLNAFCEMPCGKKENSKLNAFSITHLAKEKKRMRLSAGKKRFQSQGNAI